MEAVKMALVVLLCFPLALTFIYCLVRIGSSAFFRSKMEFEKVQRNVERRRGERRV